MQRLALLAVGNLAFCLENRRLLVTSESLCELLMRLTVAPEPRVNKAAARALAILGLHLMLDFFFFYFRFLADRLGHASHHAFCRGKWKSTTCHKGETGAKARIAHTLNGWWWDERSGNSANS